MVHTWTVGKCILYTRIRLLLLIFPFISSFFFLSNFQTLKLFITLFSGTVRSRRLKLGTHVDSGRMYRLYQNQAAAHICPFIFRFLQFSNIKIFVTLFSGTVRLRRLKLGIHMDNGGMYRGYQNHAAALIYPFIFSFFCLSNFQALKVFVDVFSETVRPRRLKPHTNMNSG